MGKALSVFPSENVESREKNMTLEGCVLDPLFCLSTLLRHFLICFPWCRETKRSRQFHHHHAGACPANVERDLLQDDREVNMQPPIWGRLQKESHILHADKRVTEARVETQSKLRNIDRIQLDLFSQRMYAIKITCITIIIMLAGTLMLLATISGKNNWQFLKKVKLF